MHFWHIDICNFFIIPNLTRNVYTTSVKIMGAQEHGLYTQSQVNCPSAFLLLQGNETSMHSGFLIAKVINSKGLDGFRKTINTGRELLLESCLVLKYVKIDQFTVITQAGQRKGYGEKKYTLDNMWKKYYRKLFSYICSWVLRYQKE